MAKSSTSLPPRSSNIFTNYLNRVAETEIDFPVVRSGVGTAA